jgi:uncharacterized membrane protein YgdD (TMEM256/DUF423 family)
MERIFTVLGSIFMLVGVAAGAFGAHALRAHFGRLPDLGPIYETAVRYHLIHGLALFVVAWAAGRWPESGLVNWAGYLLTAGIVIFSGSLYLLALTNTRWLGAITPIGGVAFLAGWLCLLVAAWRG